MNQCSYAGEIEVGDCVNYKSSMEHFVLTPAVVIVWNSKSEFLQ